MPKIMPREGRLALLRSFLLTREFKNWFMPSETWIMRGYQAQTRASDTTVRRDLDVMVNEGILERQMKRKGWFCYYEYKRK